MGGGEGGVLLHYGRWKAKAVLLLTMKGAEETTPALFLYTNSLQNISSDSVCPCHLLLKKEKNIHNLSE